MVEGDTIAAISTPPGRGGIGIIRLSGCHALGIAGAVFRSASDAPVPRRAQYGCLIEPQNGDLIDAAILTYYQSPRSYTGEDVVEISCHGSPVILGKVLKLFTTRGARVAEPGEFTLRAFLHRRLDLSQAEAVRDVIDAQTEYQARVASRQLEGGLSKTLKPVKDLLIEVIVHLESSIEFVEENLSTDEVAILRSKIGVVIKRLKEIRAGFSWGRYVTEGFDLAIVGCPNVGKSSIFNRLVGRERAIVTEVPGTTRDTLYENSSILGVPVRLIDTAGIRETDDVVESMGIARTRMAMGEADVTLLVLDSSRTSTDDDFALLSSVPDGRRIILLNKTDLPRRLEKGLLGGVQECVIEISAMEGTGFDVLTEALFQKLSGGAVSERDDLLITSVRQADAVDRATHLLCAAEESMAKGQHEEVVLLELRSALDGLGEITGETLTDDILSQIFSTFCIGK